MSPLIDKSLQMNLHKIHNLPALLPDLRLQFFYVSVGKNLAISKHGMHTAWCLYKCTYSGISLYYEYILLNVMSGAYGHLSFKTMHVSANIALLT